MVSYFVVSVLHKKVELSFSRSVSKDDEGTLVTYPLS